MVSFQIAGKKYYFLLLALSLIIFSGTNSVLSESRAEMPDVPSSELNGRTEDKAERGRYLATVSNCMTCHTAKNGKPFAGGVKFETPFGSIYSSNITQDVETGIGSWALEDFRTAMRKGVNRDGKHLYPVFPYTAYTKMSDQDIEAIYAYLITIDSVSSPKTPHEVRFPYNINMLLAVWKMLYLDEGPLPINKAQSEQWNRGAYLAEGAGHCGMCHTPRNFLGGQQLEKAYTGGVFTDHVKSGDERSWSATNLTQSSRGLAAWSKQDLIDYLTTGISKRAITFGPMNDVIMNSTRHLTAGDADALASYLMSLPANEQPIGDVASKEIIASGNALYTVHCGTCHLPTGLGAEGKGGNIGADLGVPLAGSSVVQAHDPSSLINNILWGGDVPARPFNSGRREMTPFALKMTDEEIAKLASYIRTAWGNKGGSVTPEQVEKQR